MPALSTEHLTLLNSNLESDYVAHLPALLPNTKPPAEQATKNRSRAFSAFTLRHQLGISEKEASEAVIDDFEDVGIDAIYFHGPSQTLYLVQTKLKQGAEFRQDEALAFCQGVRKCLVQDFTGFNSHFTRRQVEIENALDDCVTIQLIVAHIGAGMSQHATTALTELINDGTHGDERLASSVLEFDASRIVPALQESRANRRVDVDKLTIHKWATMTDPRTTYFGYIRVSDLVELYTKEKSALFDKNIRLFLGPKTEVSQSIQTTLRDRPDHFFYLNNGVTVLCERIEAKSTKNSGGGKRLKIAGFSVINGAQTISSAAQFVADNPAADISSARVTITLIQADADGSFGKSVTRARNHQNKVESADFLALDDEQERLRRELAVLGVQYSYKAEQNDGVVSDKKIKASEAIHALALFNKDPRYILWLKNEPSSLLDIFAERYKNLVNGVTTPFQVVNAVRFARYAYNRMDIESQGTGQEKLTYKHGASALAWILAKRIVRDQSSTLLFQTEKIKTSLSVPFDELRQALWDETKAQLAGRTPLVMYRSQERALPIVEKVMLKHYGLSTDPVIAIKRARPNKNYPEELFDYMISKAPQIGGLA
ncbi:AIPR family protein [Prosthecobacter fluviatilis]|uniref:AIPR family protein n=1 Tax=Prosthecobacter fluviatilis TaxID=445931 RepID=A0ABW0KR91_9BACT